MNDPLKHDPKPDHPIKLVMGSTYCQYSLLENKLRVISQNQRVLYDKLRKIEQLFPDTRPEHIL